MRDGEVSGSAVTRAVPTASELPSDNLQAYLPGDRRRALAEGATLPDRVQGAALFADISGFTPLTEALASELGPQRGAEELTAALDAVFAPLLEELERHSGDTIYFSGDAVTAWITGDDGRVAVSCALAMQRVMSEVGERTTPAGQQLRLGLKVAIAVGEARRFVVGDPDIQLIDVLAGALMDRLADAEHWAAKGEVVVDAATARNLGSLAVFGDLRGEHGVRVVSGLAAPVALPPARSPLPTLPDDVVRQWLLPGVYERMSAGHGEFLAELRPGIPLFLHFTGIDFDADPDATAKLDDFITAAQRVVQSNGGNVLQLTIGDKGAYLYAVFGAPVAHDNDAARACASALDLLALGTRATVAGLQVGVAAGRLRSGTYGHPERRTFCCLGDAVNLAARLMMAAPRDTALVSADVRRAAGPDFDWSDAQSLRVAGKSAVIEASTLRGRRRLRTAGRPLTDAHTSAFIGRSAESAALQAFAAAAIDGAGEVVMVTGAAGVGKSRLFLELEHWLAGRGVQVRAGSAPSYGPRTSYGVWQDLCRDAWGIEPDAPPDSVVARLRELLDDVDPQLQARLPLLGPLVGVVVPDTPLTASFDAKLRKTSLESLVIQLLEATAAQAPVAFLIDVGEQLDELSWALIEAIARRLPRMPVLLAIARRPSPSEQSFLLDGMEHVRTMALNPLDLASARTLVCDRVQARNAGQLPEPMLDRVTTLAGGNPFHLEELVNHLVDRDLYAAGDDITLPTSLHSLELARIDDLAESPRRTLKVASVIGEWFDVPVVAGTYPDLGDEQQVGRYAAALASASLVVPDAGKADAFGFRNIITQQVAYETLTFAARAALHDRVVSWLESHSPGGAAAILDVLAHHAGRGSDVEKKRHYFVLAGIAAQSRYANEAAVGYLTGALELADDEERAELHRRLGKVLEVLGRWPEAQATYDAAIAIYTRRGDERSRAHARTDLAEVARKQGRFEEARQLLLLADAAFAAQHDRAGQGTVLHLQGTLAAQQSHFAQARAAYEASLAIRQSLGDDAKIGALLSNLAVVAEQGGDYDQARELNERALAVREQVGDPWAIAVSQNNLGMIALLQEDYARATGHIAESMRLAEQVGDRWIEAVGQHNYGNARRGLADHAGSGTAFRAALEAYLEHDDRWSLALLVEDVIFLAVDTGRDREALQLLGAADAIRDELDAPRSPAPAQLIDAALGPARARVGVDADNEYVTGRRAGSVATSELVRRICS